jgi:pectinesterase
MRKIILIIVLSSVISFVHCNGQAIHVTLTNQEAFDRGSEIVELPWIELKGKLPSLKHDNVMVLDESGRESLIVQSTENDLLFQVNLTAGESRSFIIRNDPRSQGHVQSLVDGRFVLPREDYAWENDRIAFRVYGPALAKEVNNGIDVWTKRVRYLIVEKWYRESEGSPPGKDTYHADRGEGADFFSVGKSLGAGSCAIWKDGRVFQPGVFSSYKTLTNGPLRVSFELSYDSLNVQGIIYKEVKRITLDAGQNLNRIDVTYLGPMKYEELEFACGLVKRRNTDISRNEEGSWISLWGPTNDDTANGSLGTAVVMSPSSYKAMAEDNDQYLIIGKARTGQAVTYYAGAGWTRSGDFASADDWNRYLQGFARKIRSPLKITVTVNQ